MINKIKEISKALNPKMIDFCQRIVQIPSLSGYEDSVASVYMEEMKNLGYDEVFSDDWGNVIGVINGTDSGPNIMYNGHMDTVPVGNLESWGDYDPFAATIDEFSTFNWNNSKKELTKVLHGRGASDMKCTSAVQLYTGAALIELKKQGFSWQGSFILAAVVLEENGEMMGTIKLTENTLPAQGIEIDGMVCAEPSSLKLMLGHRGRMELKVVVFGKSCHGSSPWLGINAAENTAKLIIAINEHVTANAKEDPHLGKSSIALTIVENEPNALCIIPDKCTLIYDRRLVPGESVADAIAEIQSVIDDLSNKNSDFKATVEINSNLRSSYTGKSEIIKSQKEVWIIDREHPFIKACSDGLSDIGEEVNFGYWSFSTDIPQIAVKMKKPVIGYSAGQEIYIHSPDEKVRLDYLKRSLLGNISIFLKLSNLPKESFSVD